MDQESLKGAFTFYYNVMKNGTYIGLRPSEETKEGIVKLQKRLGIKNPVDPESLHTTLIYSKKGNPNVIPYEKEYYAYPLSLELFGEEKNCLVLTLESSALDFRHEFLQHMGLTHSFDSFKPHITLTYDYQGEDYDNEYLYDEKGEPIIDIVFDGEYVEPLDD